MPRLTTQQVDELRARPLPAVGNKLAIALELAGITQGFVVAETGLGRAYVSDVARGRYGDIRVSTAAKFAEVLGCAIEDIFPSKVAA